MANAFETAQGISRVAVELLVRALMLPMTVTRIPGEEFGGDNGDTITVRIRQTRTARTQASPGAAITYDDFTETGVSVSLAHLYDAGRITDEDASLNLIDFARQVTEPQVASVAVGAEDELAGAMNAVAADASFDLASTAADTMAKIQGAREALSDANVPASGRTLACAPDIITRLLNVPEFVRADALGDGPSSALRNGTIGRLYGFDVVESNALTAGTAVAYHRSGFAFANRSPVSPRGATSSASTTSQGIAMRQIFQYQPDILSDASVLSTFAGAALVDADRVYKLDTGV